MLEFIKNYRKSPERTVITISMDELLCACRQGDLMIAEHAIEKENGCCDSENDAYQREENAGKEKSESEGKKVSECSENKAKYAFKLSSEEKDEHAKENDGNFGCEALKNNENKRKSGCFPCSMGELELKGGFRCKKTVRILLCDLVASVFALCAVKSVLNKGNKR